MTYSPQTWENFPSTNTPISAARLAYMEAGIAASAPATPVITIPASGLSQTLDFDTGALYIITLSDNCTFSFVGGSVASGIGVWLILGGFTPTFTGVKWPNHGTTPLFDTANAWCSFITRDSSLTILAPIAEDLA